MWIGKATTPAERKNAMTYAHVSVDFKSIHEQLHHLLEPNRSDQILKKMPDKSCRDTRYNLQLKQLNICAKIKPQMRFN